MTTDKANWMASPHSENHGDVFLDAHQSVLEPDNCLDDALNAYARQLEDAPECPLLFSRMGQVFFLKGQSDRALSAAQKAVALAKSTIAPPPRQAAKARAEAYTIMGLVHQRSGQYRTSNQFLKQALVDSGFRCSPIRFAIFQNYRELAFQQPLSFHWCKATYALLSGLFLQPFSLNQQSIAQWVIILPALIKAWMLEECHQTEKALACYGQLAADYPGFATVRLIIGDIQRERKDFNQARFWFEQVCQRHPNHLDAHYHLAQLLEEREDYEEMTTVYHRLDALKPNDPHVQCNLANAYYYLHDYKKALAHYETALQQGTDPCWKSIVAQSIGNIYCDYYQNPQAAQAYYHLAMDFNPTTVENYIQLGMLYFQGEDYANAELIYRKAMRVTPNSARIFSNLGYLRWLAGDAAEAVQLYEQAIRLDAHYEIPINNLGVIYLDMLGDVHRAIELFQQAIALDQSYALAYYNLGRAYSFLDNRLEAAHCLQMARELNQFTRDLDNDDLSARIQRLFDTRELELLD